MGKSSDFGGRSPCGQPVDFAVPASVWKTRGMFVSHSPPVIPTHPPPAHTAPGTPGWVRIACSITDCFTEKAEET